MPQKMLTPSCCPTMLWIISVSSTVLPTPAPPNRPALPPRSSGISTSITLMPVSNISDLVERRASGGGARCTERHWTSSGAASRSMALPNTSNIRDRIPLPTGAFSGPPVSSTGMPRASPCVGVNAIPRTRCASSWARTSITISPAPRVERVNRRQKPVEAHVHDAAAHRDDDAGFQQLASIVHDTGLGGKFFLHALRHERKPLRARVNSAPLIWVKVWPCRQSDNE